MRLITTTSDADVSTVLRKIFELSSVLDQERDACLRLHEVLSAIASELKRSGGGQPQQILDKDAKTRKRFHKLLHKHINTMERLRGGSCRLLSRLGRHKTILQALPCVYERLQKLVAASNMGDKHKWVSLCDKHLAVIAPELVIQRLVAVLRQGSDKQKACAASSLAELAFHDANRSIISRAKGIAPLIALLRGTDEQRSFAANALGNLTISNEANASEIAGRGAIPLLASLLGSGTERQKGNAVFALVNLTASENNNAVIAQHDGVRLMVNLLSGPEDHKRYAAQALGNMSAKNVAHRTAIVQAGAVPLLCQLAAIGTDKQKNEAAFALGNLARGSRETCSSIAEHDGIRVLVELLNSVGRPKLAAMRTLGIIGCNNEACRSEIVQRGALLILQSFQAEGNDQQKLTANFALQKLERYSDSMHH